MKMKSWLNSYKMKCMEPEVELEEGSQIQWEDLGWEEAESQ